MKKKYEIKFPINPMLKDKIEKKYSIEKKYIELKKHKKNKKKLG